MTAGTEEQLEQLVMSRTAALSWREHTGELRGCMSLRAAAVLAGFGGDVLGRCEE